MRGKLLPLLGNDHCYAQEIEVQSPNAKSTEMTDCATFVPNGTLG